MGAIAKAEYTKVQTEKLRREMAAAVPSGCRLMGYFSDLDIERRSMRAPSRWG